jgi:hypothetical protein
LENLKIRGAFRDGDPELHEFDQFLDNRELLASILGDDRIDVYIDDGFHSIESIMTTLRSATPVLADRFVCFIEDNSKVHEEIRRAFPEFSVESCERLSVVTPAETQ